jgi:putative RecB family exonuclease
MPSDQVEAIIDNCRAPLLYDGSMYPVPTSLSPSRVEAFTSCPMAFRFASIERLPESPSPHTTKGSLVHRVLELLFMHPPAARTIATAATCFSQAVDEYAVDPEFTLLNLDDDHERTFLDDSWKLVEAYFRMEDPTAIREIGIELRLEAQVGALALRGIIDRLELDEDGGLIVTDYKTGSAPGLKYEQRRLAGVHFYSFLCEEVLGRRPTAIRLMYLRTGETITAVPSAQSVRFINTRTAAVWKAVERACNTGNFQPRQGPLCASCSFQQWCPAFGGHPELAAEQSRARHAELVA